MLSDKRVAILHTQSLCILFQIISYTRSSQWMEVMSGFGEKTVGDTNRL
ncbi:hypothetical protein SAMN05444271_102162 [Halohasta litchfieldiae]|uniref:Uncharacterized protein n=1 Tax=Halohasta litchfieldiae TaxID=1073996 RepID=A0A1H6RJ47_9EURY|nr:hypothetical protein SAMN05444271_102162 [Halohasta litchfieldiae]